jgi:POT family proton-dependent oligopeptide transporter
MVQSDDFLGHPRGLYVCFATEMWERFSFYGMKFLLLLYLTKYHLLSDLEGLSVLGGYAALVYATPVLGGLLADRYLGMRKAVVAGGVLLVCGHLGMAWEGVQATRISAQLIERDYFALQIMYLSLALIIVGVGFLKPNISTIVGKLYPTGDPRRDAGFTIFYMGINIGAFLATLLCGYLGETYGWKYGFGAAGIGMVAGLFTFLRGQRHLQGHAEPPSMPELQRRTRFGCSTETAIYLSSLIGVAVIWQMLQMHVVVGVVLNMMSLAVLLGLTWFLVYRCDSIERGRMGVLIFLIVSSVVFWALFEQSAASMTLFADRVVNRQFLGINWTAAQFGSLNSMFIFLFAPLFAVLWNFLGKRGLEPGAVAKFGLGTVQAGLGFGAIVIGAATPEASGKVAAIWLVLAYLLHTTGELCLSPVGLSAVTKLAVPRVVGVMMGAWFLAGAYSEFVAVQLSKVAAIDTPDTGIIDVGGAVASYSLLFTSLMYVGVGFGILLLIVAPLSRRFLADEQPEQSEQRDELHPDPREIQ